jgi:hypothetical protein
MEKCLQKTQLVTPYIGMHMQCTDNIPDLANSFDIFLQQIDSAQMVAWARTPCPCVPVSSTTLAGNDEGSHVVFPRLKYDRSRSGKSLVPLPTGRLFDWKFSIQCLPDWQQHHRMRPII